MQVEIYNPYGNNTVADTYVATVEQAFTKLGFDTKQVQSLNRQKKDNETVVFVVAVKDAIIAKIRGYKKVCLWVQGIVPEESYMRNGNKVRYNLLSLLEKVGLKCADFCIFVSNAMLEHFKHKYKYKSDKYYIMPCFNSEVGEQDLSSQEKYQNNVFLYAGSLDVWQCFEQTAQLYKKIEEIVPDATFRVLTRDKEKAADIIEKNNISSYSIDFRPSEDMPKEMAKAKFGFSIRQDNKVNLVSTPTKLSTYISNGVIPIYSKYISDFNAIAKEMRFAVCVDDSQDNNIEKIKQLCLGEFVGKEVFQEFKDKFGEYYSRDFHIEKMCESLKNKLIGEKE